VPFLLIPRAARALYIAIAAGLLGLLTVAPVAAAESAVVIMYHRFGEDRYPSTNTRIEQFEDHIRELTGGGYSVKSVSDIIDALRDGRELPDRTVGITMDDAYLSAYTEAFPRLQAAGLPFTLFVATDPVDRHLPGYLSWDQIREMRDEGVTIGAHSASHLHMADATPEKNRQDMQKSLDRFREELGSVPALFAYPYGETSLAVKDVVSGFGFKTAFGQHSAAIHRVTDPLYLPRFALNETYADMDDFRLRVNTVGLPVRDITPTDSFITGANPPLVGFTVDPSVGSLNGLACYHSQQGRLDMQILGTHRVEIRFPEPLPQGRSRLNCTMPAGGGRWYWFGMQYYTATD